MHPFLQSEIEDFKHRYTQKYPNDWVRLRAIRFNEVEDWLKDHDTRLLTKVREELSDKVKRHYNGYGGVLGFTKHELIDFVLQALEDK